jgi:UDP-2,3-diacylglucosamine hydrolase
MPQNTPESALTHYPMAVETRVVDAPASWRAIDFISDLHLQASHRATFEAWRHYMVHTNADAVFILGDLFEVWVGDDIVRTTNDPEADFVRQCQHILQATAQRLAVYFMHGNRDFLLGHAFAQNCGMTLLPDPSVLAFEDRRWLLSHGDALCLGDVDYQRFRQQVRSTAWQTDFLAKPLAERQVIAHGLRAQSELRKTGGANYADTDENMALQWLKAAEATTLIHGHTHKPADHELSQQDVRQRHRLVLSDWDADAVPPRLEILRLTAGTTPTRLRAAL